MKELDALKKKAEGMPLETVLTVQNQQPQTFFQSKTGRFDCASDHKRSARQARARKLVLSTPLSIKERTHD